MLSNEQKQLIFDYCLGITSEKSTVEAEELINSDNQASELYSKIKAAILPLQSIESEPCPEHLMEKTLQRAADLAPAQPVRLQQLLAVEQERSSEGIRGFWANFGGVVAAAAVILFAIGIWFAPLDFAKHKYWQLRCQRQMKNIYSGLCNYMCDYNGKIPSVATTAGAPYWKVGYQGSENHSNTRNMWLLVKGGYVRCEDFVCPGNHAARSTRPELCLVCNEADNYRDFPGRNYVTYSFRLLSPRVAGFTQQGRKILIADLNPLFENIPSDFSTPFRLKLDASKFKLNSKNHNRKGQNVLFCDGRVKFLTTRRVNISKDDIFTLQQMCPGCEIKGCEWPSCDSDTYLAP